MLHSHGSVNSFLPGLGTVRRELEKAFDDIQSRSPRSCSVTGGVSIWQDDQQIHVELDVPGFAIGDLNLNFEKGNLTVHGERQWPADRNKPEFNERRFGKFERVITLPDTVDAASIDAGLADGVLTVTFNKKIDSQPRSVQIQYRSNAGSDSASTGDAV